MNGTYDIPGIQRALPSLSEIFQRDGHELKKAGRVIFVCCPFHQEKSPSCQINDDTGKFHCFGCGAGGDAFDYWQKSRGLSFRDALAELAAMVRMGPAAPGSAPAATPRKAAPLMPAQDAPPLTGDLLQEWIHAAQSLAGDAERIDRIARWRGIDPAAVKFAADRQLMGTFRYYGMDREAFLVERPQDGSLVPVSVHVRLAPETQGNPHTKQSWRFTPAGVGSWPFVIGDLPTARTIFLMEGQWDALALVSVMGWHRKEQWPDVAVAGLRGATGHTSFLKHEINPKARIIAIADADGAGAKWFEEDGLLDRLHTRVRHVSGFWPTTEKADFNDLVKAGEITRDIMLSYLLPMMPDGHERANGPTFVQWCKENRKLLQDGQARAAAHIIQDKPKPAGRRPLRIWERHWKSTGVPPDLFLELGILWNTYRAECRASASPR